MLETDSAQEAKHATESLIRTTEVSGSFRKICAGRGEQEVM
jgi:hypothetical protein